MAAEQSPAGLTEEAGPVLLVQVVRFTRLLRYMGMKVSPGHMLDFLSALEFVGWERRDDVKAAGRTTLISRHEDLPLYDEAFDAFWRAVDHSEGHEGLVMADDELQQQQPRRRLMDAQHRDEEAKEREGEDRRSNKGRDPSRKEVTSATESEQSQSEMDVVRTYSSSELLQAKDFETFTADELAEARRVMQLMRLQIGQRKSRRLKPARNGNRIDMRRLIRSNMRYGGELMELTFRETKMKKRPLVLICDISGSMERYTRLLLQFVHTLENSLDKVEAFVFGTRLTRVTRLLRRKDIDDALDDVSKVVQDWGGGTRIGESLHAFNYEWSRRVLNQGAIVIVISDGWDRGEPELLRDAMSHLQRNCFRLIWLNPLLGTTGYQPLTRGMQAALPYCDDFLPANNLASLQALAKLLVEVQGRRPSRSQGRDTMAKAAVAAR
ncbi:MAG: vWA domain-containing protein [Thermomicrobiales bacterium]